MKSWSGTSEISSRLSKCILKSALTLPSSISSRGEASLQARHIDSFRNGTAFSMARGKWQSQATNTDILCRIDFAGSILACADPRAGCIQLRCVVSDQSATLFTPTRDEIRQIAISDTTLVAMTLSGEVCAWNLSDGLRALESQAPECIRTNVDDTQIVFVSGGIVVAVHLADSETMRFTTWNIQDRQVNHFRMQINQGISPAMYSYFAIISSNGTFIVFFERIFDESKYVRFTRMTLNGQIESSGCIEHPDIEGYSKHSENAAPVCTEGCVTLWSYAGCREVLDAQPIQTVAWEIIRVVYDTKSNQLELQRHAVNYSVPTGLTGLRARDFLWWNDVAFFANPENGIEGLEVLDLRASVCKKADMNFSKTLEYEVDPEWWFPILFPLCLLGNESFLISVRYVHPIFGFHH